MIDLIRNSQTALLQTEIDRLQQQRSRQQQARSRSSYSAQLSSYDAEQGHAIVRLPDGGKAYVQSITTGNLSGNIAVSLPRRSTIGTVDAKPA